MRRQNFARRAPVNVAASQTRALGAALTKGFSAYFSRAGHGGRTGVGGPQRGTKMAATDRFGLRLSLAGVRKPARSSGQKAKTRAQSRNTQLHCFELRNHINSCYTSSRVETIIPRRARVIALTTCKRRKYYYRSINTERRNSENSWSNCGNPAPSNSTHFRILLINKHLGFLQIGPPLANYVPPARVLMYWCPES